MKDDTKITAAKATGGGLLTASFIFFCIVLMGFAWPPASYYIGKWSDYWDSKNYPNYSHTETDTTDHSKEFAAKHACTEKADASGVMYALISASSTSPDFSTYDCYAIKWNKI